MMTMDIVWASLSCAHQRLKESNVIEHPKVCSAMLELTMAAALAEAYSKVWNSIYWNKSTIATQRRVRERLNHIAFAIADHIEEAQRLWNEYADEIGLDTLANSPNAALLRRYLTSVHLAQGELNANYIDEIESRQLSLFLQYLPSGV